MKTTRRQLLTFIGGSAVGSLFTPLPWRLVTDAALLSENWPGIPRPKPGETTYKFTNCSICPAGCAVRARLVAGAPVTLAGVANHPLSHGGLCPFGVTGHHLPYDPARLKQGPSRQAAAAAADAMAKCGPNEKIAVLDLRPGRTASWTYRRAMAAVKNGVYLAPPDAMSGAAVDFTKARTVLSIGAPLIEGWGAPGNVLAARPGFHLIHAGALETPTAIMADEWLRINPGSEAALAGALASILKKEALLANAAQATGLTETQVQDLAATLLAGSPSLVISEAPEALALNLLTGAWGQTIAPRSEAPVPDGWKNAAASESLAELPDGSIRLLMIDESAPGGYIPWNAIARKLVPDQPVVIAFACSRNGYAREAQFALPAATYPEIADDVPSPVDSPVAAFRIAAPLSVAPEGMVNPAAFIAKATGFDAGDALRERADAIYKTGRGTLFNYADGKSTPVKDVKPEDFWKALNEGGCWLGETGTTKAPAPAEWTQWGGPPGLPGFSAESRQTSDVAVALVGGRGSMGLTSPLLSKLYQESGLLLAPNSVAMHPDSAQAAGIGAHAVLRTPLGKREVAVVVDASVPRGVAATAATPATLDICSANSRAKVAQA